ncbi:MAG: hypothetical protein J6Y20_04990 [Lachnospiraceae bacterium]|nr:hypothetical protein [Kiritimatiellia bacterium]MBP5461463.1 hypothetical protein [Lachnospiraceae bacterium]
MEGYITIPRFIFDDPSYARPGVKFTKTAAIIDLIQLARFEDGQEFVNGRYILVGRGQLCKSIRELAKRWGWDEKTVGKFLKHLLDCRIISYTDSHTSSEKIPTPKNGVNRVISIVNYDGWKEKSHTDSHTSSHNNPTLIPTQSLSSTDVESKDIKQEKKKDSGTYVPSQKEIVDRLYAIYPATAKRPEGNRVALRSAKDKDKLARLLANGHTEGQIEATIRRYVADTNPPYLKMFSTFLNNLPDYSYPELTEQPDQWPAPRTDTRRNNKTTFTFEGVKRG